MIITSFVLAIVFISLIILSPYVFKCMFRIKNYSGYGIGVCYFFIYLIIISIKSVYSYFMDKFKGIKIENYISNIDLILSQKFSNRVLIWLSDVIFYFLIFLSLLCFVRMVSTIKKRFNHIFMFISGFGLLFILIYICFIILSINKGLSQEISSKFKFSENGLIETEIDIFSFLVSFAACSIMIRLHYWQANCCVFLLSFVLLFLHPIFYFVAIATSKKFYYTYIMRLSPLFSIAIAFISYCEYSTKDPYDKIDIGQLGLEYNKI